MAFKSWQSYWIFRRKIANETRYIYESETNDFINEVINTCVSREKEIKPNSVLWRSQLGSETHTIYNEDDIEIGEQTCPHPKERMFPNKEFSTDGRANPNGIAYIYLATDHKTSINECRPWLGMDVSVGKFKAIKPLKIIDCSLNHSSNPLYFDMEKGMYEPNDEEKEKAVWAHIDRAFSTPINSSDSKARYVPTQILAEAFKIHGYDGIAYKSMLGKGLNVVLFNPSNLELISRHLFEVKGIELEVTQTG